MRIDLGGALDRLPKSKGNRTAIVSGCPHCFKQSACVIDIEDNEPKVVSDPIALDWVLEGEQLICRPCHTFYPRGTTPPASVLQKKAKEEVIGFTWGESAEQPTDDQGDKRQNDVDTPIKPTFARRHPFLYCFFFVLVGFILRVLFEFLK